MFEEVYTKRNWSCNLENSKHGDEIGVGGEKMKLSIISTELHVQSPLPLEWQQCLDLQVCFLLFFFFITYCVFILFMVFLIVDVIEFTFRFVETTIPINLSSSKIDDHQACKMDLPQWHFTLFQLPTTIEACFNKYSLDGMFCFAKNYTSKVINSLFLFLFLQEVHVAISLQEN